MATVMYIRETKQSVSAMKGVMGYCAQKKKTFDPVSGRDLVSGVNCNGENAITEFMMTKHSYDKVKGTKFYHYVQSFASWDELSAVEAHNIALEFAARAWPGYEVQVCTHCDSDNPHSHFVINSVSYENGYKLRQNPNTLDELRALSDEICTAHGLRVLEPEQKEGANLSSREFRAAQKKESWKFQLMVVINDTMKRVGSREEFVRELHRKGYEVTWTPERKYITFQCPNGMKCRDIKLHDKKYIKENLENEFAIRKHRTEELRTGRSGRGQSGGHGTDRAHTVPADPLRHPGGTAGGRVSFAAEGGAIPAGVVSEDRTPGYQERAGSVHTGDGASPRGVYGSGGQDVGGNQPADSSQDTENTRTGWESAREFYFGQRFYAGYSYQGTERHDQRTGEEARTVPGLHRSHGPNGLDIGVGAVVAVAGLMNEEEEDEEERRRKYEAELAAKNTGAVIGVAAGIAMAIHEKKEQEQEQEEQLREQEEQMTMQGL